MTNLMIPLLISTALASEGAEHGAEHGIPWVPIAFHAMNLAILLIIIYRFAGASIRDALRGRATRIRKEIEDAAALSSDAEKRMTALSARLDGFEAELAGMKVQAEAESAREREEIVARAKRESALIEEATARTIRSEVAKARSELREEAVRLAMQLAEQRLKTQLRADDEDRFAADFLRSVKEVPNG